MRTEKEIEERLKRVKEVLASPIDNSRVNVDYLIGFAVA